LTVPVTWDCVEQSVGYDDFIEIISQGNATTGRLLSNVCMLPHY